MRNALHKETSPYLRQHQHNPVKWYPWGDEALRKAEIENKLIVVSIGYSACHWCHVMERESFENEEIAEVMNDHFVSIKVDREERPDIDQIYMIAVQLMTNHGGWPLNCVCLPDGRPIYGGTYFPPVDWKNVLLQLVAMWRDTPEKAYGYAERLTTGIQQIEQLPINRIPDAYTREDLEAIVTPWKRLFDEEEGGLARTPKFPMPNNWLFLLRYGALAADKEVLEQVHLTLRKMASGGIYDHIGGGFARYSVDGKWHIPHFEKMLYDNAQLVSLYAEAWQLHPTPQYKRVVTETLDWVLREMTSPDGGFYCALDADSDGVEGKFYTFEQSELEQVLGADADLFVRYFQITEAGNWEAERTNVLNVGADVDRLTKEAGYTADEWDAYLTDCKRKLRRYRESRIRPGLDDKQLTSWNALMLHGLVDAYRVFGEESYLEAALTNAAFIHGNLHATDGGLYRQPATSQRAIGGFLDDYAFCIAAYTALYEATFDEAWLYEAKRLMEYVLDHFYDPDAAVFYYTSHVAETLVARKQDFMDNVIPSSTSAIVRCLDRLGLFFDDQRYIDIAEQQLANVAPQLTLYGSSYSNWAVLLLEKVYSCTEIILTGPEWSRLREALDKHYVPNKMVLGGTKGTLPLLNGRIGERTQAYVCKHKTCSLPVDNEADLLKFFM